MISVWRSGKFHAADGTGRLDGLLLWLGHVLGPLQVDQILIAQDDIQLKEKHNEGTSF